MGAIIRRASRADVDQLAMLWKELAEFHSSLAPEFVPALGSEKYLADHFAELIGMDRVRIFVADEEGTLIGFVSGKLHENPPAFLVRQVGFIDDAMVTARSRRCGVGEQLVNALMAWFRERKAQVVHLNAATSNPAAQAFWHKMGFVDVMTRMRREVE